MDEVDSIDDPLMAGSAQGCAPSLMSLRETLLGGMGVDEKVRVALICVTPSTGDVVWDEFEDGLMRSELEVNYIPVTLYGKPRRLLTEEYLG